MASENLNLDSPMPKAISYIGLGSNLNEPAQQLVNAIEALKRLPKSELVACSSFYRSQALTLNGDDAIPDYVNAVVAIKTELDPFSLLDQLQAIEFAQGRVRGERRWQPRTLDLDILLFDDNIMSSERLIVPHPEMCKRDFVLVPLAEIATELEIPGQGKLSNCLASCQKMLLEKIPFEQSV